MCSARVASVVLAGLAVGEPAKANAWNGTKSLSESDVLKPSLSDIIKPMKPHTRRTAGFTIIELVVVVIILCLLGTLVALTYNGVKAENRDKQRQADIEIIQSQLEIFDAIHDTYPPLADINNPTWRAENMKNLTDDIMRDPRWSPDGPCAQDGKPILAAGEHCYNYEVSAADGSPCGGTVPCDHYTVTATLENGQQFVKASLN